LAKWLAKQCPLLQVKSLAKHPA